VTNDTSSGCMTEERLAMQRVARDFTLREVSPIANKLDPVQGDIPRDLIERMGDLGFFGIMIPVPVANQIRTYWWCSPPRIGWQRMSPASSTAVCTENLIRVAEVMEWPKLAE
jgi:alkylation response protein AidB-like acyl-CoA dehydrogenase